MFRPTDRRRRHKRRPEPLGVLRVALPVLALGAVTAVTSAVVVTDAGSSQAATAADAFAVDRPAGVAPTGGPGSAPGATDDAADRYDAALSAQQIGADKAASAAVASSSASAASASASASSASASAAAAQAARNRQAAASQASRGDSRDPRAIAQAMLADRGWAGQFSCLDALWTKESGWKVSASNPSSGAYGIPQALPGSKMSSAGSDWRTNPATQIAWGLGYIADRYGTPCAAWAHSQAVNWY